jgi:hypothetical protein
MEKEDLDKIYQLLDFLKYENIEIKFNTIQSQWENYIELNIEARKYINNK